MKDYMPILVALALVLATLLIDRWAGRSIATYTISVCDTDPPTLCVVHRFGGVDCDWAHQANWPNMRSQNCRKV